MLTYVCSYWGFYTLLTNVPTYLNNIQHIPLTLVSLTIFENIVYIYVFTLFSNISWFFLRAWTIYMERIHKNGKIHLNNGLCNGAISNKIVVIVMGFTNASWHIFLLILEES